MCHDKEEIIRKAEDIGTFEISIIPHDDCCVRFLPARPETKAKPDEVAKEEEKLDTEKLVNKALKKTNKIIIPFKR